MANTPQIVTRVEPGLIDAARERIGQPNIELAVLVRVGLGVLAGQTVPEALQSARTRPGPKRRTDAVA